MRDAVEAVALTRVFEQGREHFDELAHLLAKDALAPEFGHALRLSLQLVADGALLLGLADESVDVVEKTAEFPLALRKASGGGFPAVLVHENALALDVALVLQVELLEQDLQLVLGILDLDLEGVVALLVVEQLVALAHEDGEVLPVVAQLVQTAHLEFVDDDHNGVVGVCGLALIALDQVRVCDRVDLALEDRAHHLLLEGLLRLLDHLQFGLPKFLDLGQHLLPLRVGHVRGFSVVLLFDDFVASQELHNQFYSYFLVVCCLK